MHKRPQTPEDIPALHSAMLAQTDIADQCLAKANAIVNVLSQMPSPPVDLHDEICTVLWAASDMLHDARAAMKKRSYLEKRYMVAVDPDRERAARILQSLSEKSKGGADAD